MATNKKFDPYFENVTKAVKRNLKWMEEHPQMNQDQFLQVLVLFIENERINLMARVLNPHLKED